MAYTPINWQTGDTITAEKLNKMDNGWEVSSSQLFSETVTTAVGQGGMVGGPLAYNGILDMPSLIVTFDGTDYDCQRIDAMGAYFYGGFSPSGPDFTEFPFAIQGGGSTNFVFTETAGTYAIEAGVESIDVSSEFVAAVESCVNTSTMPMECVSDVTTLSDMVTAYGSGRILFFKPYGSQVNFMCFITSFTSSSVSFIPENSGITATISNDIFTVSTT